MNRVYRCDFIFCATFLDSEHREYYFEDTLTNVEIEADNIRDLLFGLIHYANDYTQENYTSDDFRKYIKPIDDNEYTLPNELSIKGISIEQVIELIEIEE